jgi:succinyl-CoA synthetase beta subunit
MKTEWATSNVLVQYGINNENPQKQRQINCIQKFTDEYTYIHTIIKAQVLLNFTI